MAISSMMGPHSGSSSMPGFLKINRALSSSASKEIEYGSHPCTLYNVWRSTVCDAGGTDTFNDSNCAHVRAALKVTAYVDPFSTDSSWLISASLPNLAACLPRGTMRSIPPPTFSPDDTSSTMPLVFQLGISVGPSDIASLGKPFDGAVSKSPFATSPTK
ncbi:hypothetical protein QQP08_018357 [Theobroma cacao]|nr:hypothetical protein QQP08_018357 [Theobroma cacao]